MSETADREPSGWRELPALQPKIQWLAQGDSNLFESEGVVCNLGFDQHCLVKKSTRKDKTFENAEPSEFKMSSLVRLMDLNTFPDELEYRTRASLSDELRHLLSGKHVPKTDTAFSEPSPILSHKNIQEDENLLKSTSTEHAHHSREKEPKEVDWKNGAPSPESILSYDFPNDSAYSVRQLDCQSDFTEGTNGLSLAPFGSNVNNPSNGTRSRAFSTDASLNGFASGDAWDPNETLSTQERSETQDEFEEHSLHGLLPGLGTEDTSFEHTPQNAVLHLHDIHTNNLNTINTINTTQHNHRSPALSTVLECSGTSEFSRTSGLGGRDTFSATVATPLSPDSLFGEPIHPSIHSHTNVVVDTLVMPTVLNSISKGLIVEVLAEQGAEVKRVHSSAVALVTSYLTTEEVRISLIHNAGYLRVLVLEASAGIVSAAVVTVESPLQSDLIDLNNNNNTSTSTDTNISSSPCSSNHSTSVHTSATSTSDPPTTPNSSEYTGKNDNSAAAADSNTSQNSIYSSSTNGNNSPVDTNDTSANSSNNPSTTVSTPVGMQESTYVLSDSAYIPAHPMTEHVPVGSAEDADVQKHTTRGASHTAITILPCFSEDSADYTNPNISNKAATTNISNTIHTTSSNSPSPELPFARSAVVRVECAVWSHYNNDTTKDSHGPPTSTSKAVPLQDYHYSMATRDSDTTSGQTANVEGNKQSAQDLQIELVSCVEMLLAQQASMHSPFRSTASTTNATNHASSNISTPALPRRSASYHSLELDQRLYGHTTAAALHDLETTANRMDMHTRNGGDNSGDSSGMGVFEVPVPVSVLDAVLFWSPNAVAGVSSETTTADKTHTLENALLQAVQAVVQPHLRAARSDLLVEAGDYPPSTNKSDLAASQVTMEGSYVALSPLTRQMRQQACDRIAQNTTTHSPPMLPLLILPTNAVLHGASLLQSLPCDVLRVYECSNTHVLQGGTIVLDTPAVGVIVRTSYVNNNITTTSSTDIFPDEEVIWLNNPVAAAAVCGDGYAALGRADRECSLLLTTSTNTSTESVGGTTTMTVKAEPCSVSRRSCPLKPSVSVRAFVQHPPPDTACVVQPSSSIYRSDAFLPDSTSDYSSNMDGDKIGQDNSCGVLKGNLFFPATQPTTAVAPPAASPGVSILGLYAAVCNRLHYLVFLGSTYYIQYFQADVSVSVDRTADSRVGMEHTPGVQTVAVSVPSISTPIAANATTTSRWELLIVTQPTLQYGTDSNIRIVNTITLPSEPSYCQQLIALEEGNIAAEKATSPRETRAFPPCLVSLSAADSAGLRSIIIQPMTGPSSEASTDDQDPSTITATTVSTSRRKKKQPAVQKRHYVKLTHSSYQLLQFREKQHREIRSVRNTIQLFVLLVLSVGALLMFIMLMEVMWVQRQYAVRDVVTPARPVSQPMHRDTDTTVTTKKNGEIDATSLPTPVRRVPTFTTTTTTTTSTSSYTTATSPSKANLHTNSIQRMYYHTCKMNPMDPFLPAVCTTYVTNEETSELTVVVVQDEDMLHLHDVSGREGMHMGKEAGGVKIYDYADTTTDTTTTTSRDSTCSDMRDSGATVSTPAAQPCLPIQPFDSTTGAEPTITSKIAPTPVPETVPIVQHDCGIILPPDLGVVSAPAPAPIVLEAAEVIVDSADRYMDPSASVDSHVYPLQEESLQVDSTDNILSDEANVKAVVAQMDSESSFDYAAKQKLLADLEEISTMMKEIVQMLDGEVASEDPVSSAVATGELCVYDLAVEGLQKQGAEGLEVRAVDEEPAVVQVTAVETVTATPTTDTSIRVAATEVTTIHTTTDTTPAYRRTSTVFDWLHTAPKPQYNTRLSAVRESVRDVVYSIPPMCRYYMHQCQLHLQHYYYCTTQYLHHQQQQFSAWSAHTTHAAQRALQHTTYTITTSPYSKALQRHYATLHTTITHTIDTYYPIIYDTLHLDELSAWTQEKAAIVKEDLYSFYEVTHLKALSAWLHTHSVTIRTHMSAQRRATLKSQQELLLQGRQVWHIIVNASAQYARGAQRAVYSSGTRLHTAVSGLGTTLYTHTVTMTEAGRVIGAQALLIVQRAVEGILTGF